MAIKDYFGTCQNCKEKDVELVEIVEISGKEKKICPECAEGKKIEEENV